jgi:hypothetical protein
LVSVPHAIARHVDDQAFHWTIGLIKHSLEHVAIVTFKTHFCL